LNDDERMSTLERQLAEAQLIAEEADRRYDEVCVCAVVLVCVRVVLDTDQVPVRYVPGCSSYSYYGS
jgi:hypothetical protein